MKHPSARCAVLIATTLLLGACSSLDILSFGGIKEQDTARTPPGATAYQCAEGKRLFVRYLDNAAWVILPDREFRLDRSPGSGSGHYSNGSDTLEVSGDSASLSDGAKTTYAACKATAG